MPYYNEQEKHRHDVRPGLSGLAQVNGRNNVTWEEKFAWDIKYVENMSLGMDIGILFKTIKNVISSSEDVTLNAIEDFDEYRKSTNTIVQDKKLVTK